MQFLRATVAGGFFVILPIALIWLILVETIGIVDGLVAPIVEQLPVDELGGVEVATLVAIALILLACFVTGLLVRTAPVARLGRWLERLLLRPIPGYILVKTLTQRFAGASEDSRFAPALITVAPGYHELGFIVEQHDDGQFTVFIPLAPTPAMGTVRLVAADRVRPLQVPMTAVVNSIMQWGIGSKGFGAAPEPPPG